MHTTNPAGLALLVRGTELPSRLQAWLPDVPVACAATPAELAALLRDPRWRAVAVEVAALGERAEELLPRLSALFPDVPLIAIGGSADARRLEPLVSAGCVQRFLRQPLGQKRTRTCLQSVLARPDCAARAPAMRTASPTRAFVLPRRFTVPRALSLTGRTRRALLALAALAAFLGLAAAVASGTGAAAPDGAGAASATLPATARPATAHAAQRAGHGGVARVAATAPAVDVTPLLAAAADARARGALLEPEGDNAVYYYRRAIAAAPGDARARIALDNLGTTLLAAGEDALAHRRHAEAAGRVAQAARVLGEDARVRDLQARLRSSEDAARERAAARREAWARAAREWSASASAEVPAPASNRGPG